MDQQLAIPRPILYMNDTKEAEDAKELLEKYDIDFEERRTNDEIVWLEWGILKYHSILGIADFIMIPGSIVRQLKKKGAENNDTRLPGRPISFSKRPLKKR